MLDDDNDDDRSASALDLLGSAGAGEFSEAFYAGAGATGRQAAASFVLLLYLLPRLYTLQVAL